MTLLDSVGVSTVYSPKYYYTSPIMHLTNLAPQNFASAWFSISLGKAVIYPGETKNKGYTKFWGAI